MSVANFTEYRKGQQVRGTAALSIYPARDGAYITQAALDEYFRRGGGYASQAVLLTDRDTSTLAFDIDPESTLNAYSISHKSQEGGAQLALASTLRNAFDADPEDLEQSFSTPLEKDDETGYIVADLKDLVEQLTDDVHCPECGERYTETGVKTHIKKTHEGTVADTLESMDPDDIGGEVPEGDDSWKDVDAKAGGQS